MQGAGDAGRAVAPAAADLGQGGAGTIANLSAHLARQLSGARIDPVEVGGERALATYHDGVLRWIDCFDVVDGRITTV